MNTKHKKAMVVRAMYIMVILALAFSVTGTASVQAEEPVPFVQAFAWFDGYYLVDWQPGVQVDVTIYDPFTSATYIGESFTPDELGWYGFVAGVDLKPGVVISASNSIDEKVLEISNLSATVDPNIGVVTGVATPNRTFHMKTDGDHFPLPIEQDVTVGLDGNWSVTINEYLPWEWLTRGEMWETDDDGDVTYAIWHVQQNIVEVWLAQNEIHAFGWPRDTELTFNVDGVDIGTAFTQPVDWIEGTWAVINAGDYRVQLEPGMTVTVSGAGASPKSVIVQDLKITNIDIGGDVVYGYAPPNASLELGSWEDSPVFRFFNNGDDANWTVDYKEPSLNGVTVDLNPGDELRLFMRDDEKNATVWGIWVPNPYIWADPICNCVNGWDWFDGDNIMLQVFDQGGNQFELENPTQTYSVNEGVFFDLGAEGIDLQSGYKVAMGNGMVTKELIVSPLVVKEMNPVASTIFGIFDPSLDIVIQTGGQNPLSLDFTGDKWVATFASLPLDGSGEVYQPDEDGDKTGMGWDGVPTFMRYDIYSLNVQNMDVKRITKLDGTGEYDPSWSPNGKKVVHDVVYWDGSQGLHITDVATGVSKPLVGAEDGGNDAVWSSNGKWIVFDRRWVGEPNLYILPSTGGVPTLVRSNAVRADWAPNSKRLVFQDMDGSIRTAPVDGGKNDVTTIASNGTDPDWSPDGNWIAYVFDGDLWKQRVNVQGTKFGNPIRLTSTMAGVGAPTWSADSQTIVFNAGEDGNVDLWSVPAIGGAPTWLAGVPEYGEYGPEYASSGPYIAYAGISP